MATKSKRGTEQKPGNIVFTETAIVISLTAADQKRVKQCLAKNGKITFSIEEHSTTTLPKILDNGIRVD